MTKFQDFDKIAEEENIGGNDWFRLKDGENKVRFVTEMVRYAKHFSSKEKKSYICADEKCSFCLEGYKKQLKFLGWIIDRESGQFKLLEIGWQIFKQIGELATSSEYQFEGLPPFDFIIKKKGEGLDTEYFVQPARKETELTSKEKEEIKALTPPKEIKEKMLEKNIAPEVEDSAAKAGANGEGTIDIKDIPF